MAQTDHLPAFTAKMAREDLPAIVIDTFAHYYRQLVSGATGRIAEVDIEPVPPQSLRQAEELGSYAEAGKRLLQRAVKIVLNGGLGTSMGLDAAKCLLEVKPGRSFLSILLEQARRTEVALAFMNSFNTHRDTVEAVSKLAPRRQPAFFLQHKFPKVLRESLAPAAWPQNPALEWNPPGHGDLYTALFTSGTLQRLLDAGITYAFIANADNLGATLDVGLLGYFAENDLPFMMETARRTASDTKGGHLARDRKSGRLLLREIAQCPAPDLAAFQEIERHRFFNTNNLWINLSRLNRLIALRGRVQLPIIVNPKRLDPRDPDSPAVLQIETAMGSAIFLFEGAVAVQTPPHRFFPVKTCEDLLALRSDAYTLNESGELIPSPACRHGRIRIRLDPTWYGRIDRFEERFAAGVPSLVECRSLSIAGNVFFEPGVTLRGEVSITAGERRSIIPAGTVVSGELSL